MSSAITPQQNKTKQNLHHTRMFKSWNAKRHSSQCENGSLLLQLSPIHISPQTQLLPLPFKTPRFNSHLSLQQQQQQQQETFNRNTSLCYCHRFFSISHSDSHFLTKRRNPDWENRETPPSHQPILSESTQNPPHGNFNFVKKLIILSFLFYCHW